MQEHNILDEPLDNGPIAPKEPVALVQWLLLLFPVGWLAHYAPSMLYDWWGVGTVDRLMRPIRSLVLFMGLLVVVQQVRQAIPASLRLMAWGFTLIYLVYLAQVWGGWDWYTWVGYETMDGLTLVSLLIFVAALQGQTTKASMVWRQLWGLAIVYWVNQLLLKLLTINGMALYIHKWWVDPPLWLLVAWVLLQIDTWQRSEHQSLIEKGLTGSFTLAVGALWSARVWTIDALQWQSASYSVTTVEWAIWTWLVTWLFCLGMGLALVVYHKKDNTALDPD